MLPRALSLTAFALALASPLLSDRNRLSEAQSPYLLQHADNPVHWYEWGPEAFQAAETQNKLIFVSIGYSTCHWCHVMNRESFSNEEIAAYLNENYICIKIDREERPDVDSVYMNFVQNLTGSGGWPLNVWLTPDRKPFFGGTYFPPQSQRGRPGFADVIRRINDFWESDPAAARASSAQMVATLNAETETPDSSDEELGMHLISNAISSFQAVFDPTHAGFGSGEKFPSPANLSFLLRAARMPQLPAADRAAAIRLALQTLDAMAKGGIRDHVGGGFHRYTVDAGWQLPHFEKMLYDQALVAEAYIDAWQLTADPTYKTAATEALDYLLREMRHPSGAFYSAEDAESIDPENTDSKREGAYYTWTTEEFDQLFQNEKKRALAKAYFTMAPEGNVPGSDFLASPFHGHNILRIERDLSELALEFDLTIGQAEKWIEEAQAALRARRSERVRPHLDDKVITSWNGLAVSAFARAAQAFDRPDYAQVGTQVVQFISDTLYNAKTQRLARLYRGTVSEVEGFAEDYAYLIDGLLDLYEATARHEYIVFAHELQETQNELFYDRERRGFLSFRPSEEIVFDPLIDSFDGAIPTPSSMAAQNLARLGQFLGQEAYTEQAKAVVSAFVPQVEQSPTRLPALLGTLAYIEQKPLQIVLAGSPNSPDMETLLRIVNQQLLPNRILMYADLAKGQDYLGQGLEFIKAVSAIDGKATAYVCEDFVCQLPVNEANLLAKQLAERFQD